MAIEPETVEDMAAELDHLRKRNVELAAAFYDATDGISGTLAKDEIERLRSENANLHGALVEIAACETASANATVRRMAVIARGAAKAGVP